jgi:hypothetical protein
MRSTRASAAVARLNARDSDHDYSLGVVPGGLCCLLRIAADGSSEKISADLELDEFVRFVNQTGPQQKVRVSKFDTAFEKQLHRKKDAE